ncbi:MAG TPA: hypothetical protein VFE14_18355 [Micromonosporaceae bacterium]|jgi:hypothetical protein|nr:hypothetical protein [Micromonosporaceae bacterium]
MPGMWWVVGVVVAIVLIATYLTWTAGRVDRLHARAAAAARALDAHLVRRAAAAAVLAEERLPPDGGAPDVYAAARAALDARPDEREAAENDLTHLLRKVSLRPEEGVVVASRRVALARQVHNDVVRDALAVRRRPLVRVLGLTRRHPTPTYFDVDDTTLDT